MSPLSLALTIILVLAVIYIVPFVVYGGLSAFGMIEPPEGSPAAFLVGVLVSKVGTAFAFVMIFHLARHDLDGRWLAYAGLWFVMYALGEIGQAMGPDYGWEEAAAGIMSEAIYFPAAAYIVDRMIAA